MEQLPSHQVIGTRVGHMPTHEMVDLWVAVTSGIVKYGFAIEYRDLEPPRTGIFDGLRIVIDPDVGFEMQCFLLLHLFGHSVQWVAPSHRAQARARCSTRDDRAQFMRVLHDYEFEAAGFGLQLLHERGVTGTTSGTATSSTPTGATSSATTRPTSCRPGTSASSAAVRSSSRDRFRR